MDEMERRFVETRSELVAEGGRHFIEGLATPFGRFTAIGSLFLEAISPTAFKRSTDTRGSQIPLPLAHKQDERPIGKPVEWEYREDGLYARWELAPGTDDVRQLAADGYITGLSVGFQPEVDDWDHSGAVPKVTRKIARLCEVSLVNVPAVEEARVLCVRSAGIGHPKPLAVESYRRWLEGVKSSPYPASLVTK